MSFLFGRQDEQERPRCACVPAQPAERRARPVWRQVSALQKNFETVYAQLQAAREQLQESEAEKGRAVEAIKKVEPRLRELKEENDRLRAHQLVMEPRMQERATAPLCRFKAHPGR